MKASDIIALFDGPTRLSETLGLPLSTVHRWGRANFIPEWRQPKLLELAASRNLALSTTDFPTTGDRISLSRAA